MKILAYIICVFKSLPNIVTLEIENFTEHLKKFSEVEKRTIEQRQIIETIRTLDLKKVEHLIALDKAIEGNYKEVIQILVQSTHKYSK